jgi:hypothetical protein
MVLRQPGGGGGDRAVCQAGCMQRSCSAEGCPRLAAGVRPAGRRAASPNGPAATWAPAPATALASSSSPALQGTARLTVGLGRGQGSCAHRARPTSGKCVPPGEPPPTHPHTRCRTQHPPTLTHRPAHPGSMRCGTGGRGSRRALRRSRCRSRWRRTTGWGPRPAGGPPPQSRAGSLGGGGGGARARVWRPGQHQCWADERSSCPAGGRPPAALATSQGVGPAEHQARLPGRPTRAEEHVVLNDDGVAVPPLQEQAVQAPAVVLRQPCVPRLPRPQRRHPRRLLPKLKAARRAEEVGSQGARHCRHARLVPILRGSGRGGGHSGCSMQ